MLITSARANLVARGKALPNAYVNLAPVWSTVPAIQFTEGTGANSSIASYVSDPNPGETVTFAVQSGTLPTGVTLSSAGVYQYNGIGAAGSGSIIVRATDNGTPTLSADSNSHSVQVLSNLAWTGTPTTTFTDSVAAQVNLGSYVAGYNAATDVFSISGNPAWLTLTGTGGVLLSADGTQTDGGTGDGASIIIGVSRSGGAYVYTGSLAVTVTAAPGQSTGGTRVQFVETVEGPDWQYANGSAVSYLSIPWANYGGDWRDSANVAQGSTAYSTQTLAGLGIQTKSWSIGPLITKLRADNTAIFIRRTGSLNGFVQWASKEHTTAAWRPTLTVTAGGVNYTPTLLADSCIIGDSLATGQGQQGANSILSGNPILKFDLSVIPLTATVSSATLSMTTFNQGSGAESATFGTFFLDMPTIVTNPAVEIGGVVAGIAGGKSVDTELAADARILNYGRFDSHATIWDGNWSIAVRPAVPGYGQDEWTYLPTYVEWEDYGITTGVVTEPPFSVNPTASGAKLWKWAWPLTAHNNVSNLGPANPLPLPRPWQNIGPGGYGPEQAYMRAVLRLQPGALAALIPNHGGMKLYGLQGAYDVLGPPPGTTGDGWSAMFYFHVSPAHPTVARLGLYWYDNDFPIGGGSGQNYWLDHNFCMKEGQKYSLEQYVKMNTSSDGGATYNRDGIFRVWVDGVLMWERTNLKLRSSSFVRVNELPALQFFTGGAQTSNLTNPVKVEFGAAALSLTDYIGPPVKPLPAWTHSSVVGQWMDVPGTAPNLVAEPPQPPTTDGWQIGNTSARLDAWCGPAFRRSSSTFILGPSGGHGDYFLNWISEYELGLDTPQARMLYTGSTWDKMWPASHFASDGRGPHPLHTYYSAVFCEERDWLMHFGLETRQASQYPFSTLAPAPPSFEWYDTFGPGPSQVVGAFDYQAKTWLPRATVPNMLSIAGTGFPLCRHPVTGDIFYGHEWTGTLNKWTQATNTHVVLPGTTPWGESPMAVDPIRNRVFNTATSATPATVFDCNTGAYQFVTLTGPFAAQVKSLEYGRYAGMVWDEHNEAFIFCANDADGKVRLIRIDPVTFVCTEFVTTNRPDNTTKGALTAIHYAPNLRGLVLMNKYNQNIKYLRLW